MALTTSATNEMRADIANAITVARSEAPTDILTRAVLWAVRGITTTFSILFAPVALATTFLGGCLITLTLGLFLVPLNLAWLSLFYPLLGTSWLWLRVWWLRPILLIPGIMLAILGWTFVQLTPMPEEAITGKKILYGYLAGEWPLTFSIWHHYQSLI